MACDRSRVWPDAKRPTSRSVERGSSEYPNPVYMLLNAMWCAARRLDHSARADSWLFVAFMPCARSGAGAFVSSPSRGVPSCVATSTGSEADEVGTARVGDSSAALSQPNACTG